MMDVGYNGLFKCSSSVHRHWLTLRHPRLAQATRRALQGSREANAAAFSVRFAKAGGSAHIIFNNGNDFFEKENHNSFHCHNVC